MTIVAPCVCVCVCVCVCFFSHGKLVTGFDKPCSVGGTSDSEKVPKVQSPVPCVYTCADLLRACAKSLLISTLFSTCFSHFLHSHAPRVEKGLDDRPVDVRGAARRENGAVFPPARQEPHQAKLQVHAYSPNHSRGNQAGW